MKSITIILNLAVLIACLVRRSDAVACSDTILSNCTDCSDGNNVDNVDCTTTTTTTTTSSPIGNNRNVVLSNLRYTNYRRLRVNGGNAGTAGTGTGTGTTGTGTANIISTNGVRNNRNIRRNNGANRNGRRRNGRNNRNRNRNGRNNRNVRVVRG